MNVVDFPSGSKERSYFTGDPKGEEFVEFYHDQHDGRWSMYLVRTGEPPRRLATFEDREAVEAYGAFLLREAARRA